MELSTLPPNFHVHLPFPVCASAMIDSVASPTAHKIRLSMLSVEHYKVVLKHCVESTVDIGIAYINCPRKIEFSSYF